MNVAQETLGLRRPGLSPGLSLLMSAFALPIPPAALTSHLHRPTERSPTVKVGSETTFIALCALAGQTRKSSLTLLSPAISVPSLAPLHLPRRTTRPVSYYAFFK